MKKILKILIIVFMIISIAVTVINVIAVHTMAVNVNTSSDLTGTLDEDGECTNRPSNC